MSENDSDRRSGFEVAFAFSVGCALFLANILLAGLLAGVGYFDEYLQFSIVLLGIAWLVLIEKAALSGSGATVLGIICFLIIAVNLFFVGYGDM